MSPVHEDRQGNAGRASVSCAPLRRSHHPEPADPFPAPGLLAAVGLLLALLITAPASARMQCDCGNYLMSCMAGCLGNPYCTSRCQQFHDTCVSSCSGTYSGGDRHHRHDEDEDHDDDRYPRHRHW